MVRETVPKINHPVSEIIGPMLCIQPAMCMYIRNEILCIRHYGRPYAQTHRCYAYGRPNLTLTRPCAYFSSLLYFMAVALNRSFCFFIVKHLMRSLKILCRVFLKIMANSFAMQFAYFLSKTTQLTQSSSAVANRLRDASCLSIVSFNNTKRRVESFIVSYVGYRFITACS